MLFAAVAVLLINTFARRSCDLSCFSCGSLTTRAARGRRVIRSHSTLHSLARPIVLLLAGVYLPEPFRSPFGCGFLMAGMQWQPDSAINAGKVTGYHDWRLRWNLQHSCCDGDCRADRAHQFVSRGDQASLSCPGIAALIFTSFQALALFRKQSSKAIIPLGYVLICLFFDRSSGCYMDAVHDHPVLVALLVRGISARPLGRSHGPPLFPDHCLASGSVVLLLLGAVVGTKMRDFRLEVYGRPNLALADFIETYAPNAKSYMCSDIGIPAFRLEIAVLDFAGLVSKEMLARSPLRGSPDAALIKSKKPDVVALRADIFSVTGYPEAFVYRRSFSSDPAEASQEAHISEKYRILRKSPIPTSQLSSFRSLCRSPRSGRHLRSALSATSSMSPRRHWRNETPSGPGWW